MSDKYITPNLWTAFQEDCPWVANIPFIRFWAFGHWARGYFDAKQPESRP